MARGEKNEKILHQSIGENLIKSRQNDEKTGTKKCY